MSKLLAAYTPPTSPYPPFVNITRQDNGDVTVLVRGAPRPGEFSQQDCGPDASFTMSAAEWADVFSQLQAA